MNQSKKINAVNIIEMILIIPAGIQTEILNANSFIANAKAELRKK